jgi:hypothetical protein
MDMDDKLNLCSDQPTNVRNGASVPVESQAKARMTPFDSRERLDGRATGTAA